MSPNDHIEILIAKALSGEASATEMAELHTWENASTENKAFVATARKLFDGASQVANEQEFNTDIAWNAVRAQLHQEKSPQVKSFYQSPAWNLVRIAAMIILLVGVGYVIYEARFRETTHKVTITSADKTATHKLPDSTEVMLNKHSKIEYSFSDTKREVVLIGEAFFELAPDPERPFEVHTGELTIRDIGTAFNVDAPEGSDTVLVYVESGEVILAGRSGVALHIKGGGRAAYVRSRDELLEFAISDTNALAWKTKVFVFENAGLESVAQKVSEVYDIKVMVAEEARNCKITATFVNETPENVIDIIAETLQLNVRRENGRVILEGGNCADK